MKNQFDGEEIEARQEGRKRLGEGAAAASLGLGRAPFFFFNCLLFLFFFYRFLVMVFSWVFFLCRLGFLSNHPPFFLPPEICIYSARVPSLVRNQVSIKLILFFEV
jgi:hypothetical protein